MTAALGSQHEHLPSCLKHLLARSPSVKIHSAHAWVAALAAGADRRFGGFRSAVGVGGKCGKLLPQMFFAAGWARDIRGIGGAAHQLFKFGSAIFATVFVNGHESVLTPIV